MSKTIYRCPFCDKKYIAMEKSKQPNAKKALYQHMEKNHENSLGGLSPAQVYFNYKYNKTCGRCVICGKETKWNESTERYNRFCSEKCKNKYRDDFKKKMKDKYGDENALMNDPEHQKKMLANRRISGKYKWSDGKHEHTYTGSYEKDFLEFLDIVMKMDPEDVFAPAPNAFKYKYEGKDHFYIPDFYIASLNLYVEIKDGGSNPNTHPKIQAIDKAKEKEKDKIMNSNPNINYVKVENKDYSIFLNYLIELKYKN